MSAIGHERDSPLLDFVADLRVDAHGRCPPGGARPDPAGEAIVVSLRARSDARWATY